MEIKTFEMRELKADKDKVLTNGEAFSSIGGSVYLGKHDSPENWHEIAKEEYEKFLEESAKEDFLSGGEDV